MRIKPLVVLSLVCSLSQAADTVASLGDSIKATQFVTTVDHSHITDGIGKVYFVDGIPYADVITTTTVVEREPVSVWFYPTVAAVTQYTPPWSSIKVEVDYSSWTNSGEYVVTSGRRIKDIVSPNNYLYVSDYSGNPDPEGVYIYTHEPNVEVPYVGELAQVFPGQAVVCNFFMRDAGTLIPFETQAIYTNYTETAITVFETNSYRIATTADIQPTNGLASMVWVNSKKWDWSTQIINKPTNVSAFNNDAEYVTANHTHSNLVNGTTEVIANADGTASITAPAEWAFVTQLTDSQRQSLAQYMQSQYSFNGDWTVTINNHNASWWESEFASGTHSGIDYEDYMSVKIGNVTAATGIMDWDNKICICASGDANILDVLVPSYEPQVSPIAQFIGGIKTIATVDRLPTVPANVSAFNNDANYTSGQIATNIAKQIIHDAVSGVNTDIQTAEDARVALTNLITILKNL